jgi:hypothetical protein
MNVELADADVTSVVCGPGVVCALLRGVIVWPIARIEDELLTSYGRGFDAAHVPAPPAVLADQLAASPAFRSGGTMGLINAADLSAAPPSPPSPAAGESQPTKRRRRGQMTVRAAGLLAIGPDSRAVKRGDWEATQEGVEAADDLTAAFQRLVSELTTLDVSPDEAADALAAYDPDTVMRSDAASERLEWLRRAGDALRLEWEPHVARALPVVDQANVFQCVRGTAVLASLDERVLLAACNALMRMVQDMVSPNHPGSLLLRDDLETRACSEAGKGYGLFAIRPIEIVRPPARWGNQEFARAAAWAASDAVSELIPGAARRLVEAAEQLAPGLPAQQARQARVENIARALSRSDDPRLRPVARAAGTTAALEAAARRVGDRRAWQRDYCEFLIPILRAGAVLPLGMMRGVARPLPLRQSPLAVPDLQAAVEADFVYDFPMPSVSPSGVLGPPRYNLVCTLTLTGDVNLATADLLEQATVLRWAGDDRHAAVLATPDPVAQAVWDFWRDAR